MGDKEAVLEVLKRNLGDQVVETRAEQVAQDIAGQDGEWEEEDRHKVLCGKRCLGLLGKAGGR